MSRGVRAANARANRLCRFAGNPQAYNRYTYVLNNPVRYTDPSGHWIPETTNPSTEQVLLAPSIGRIGVVFTSPYAGELRKQTLHRTAVILKEQVTTDPIAASLGQGITAAEAMMATVYQGVRLSRNRTPVFMEDVSAVLSGHTIDLGSYLTMKRPEDPKSNPYYVPYEGSLGLKSRFRDPDPMNEQVHHFWFYVQLAYETEGVVALAANIYHEGYWKQDGRSLPDYRLGRAGQRLGSLAELSYFWPIDIAEWLTTHVVQ